MLNQAQVDQAADPRPIKACKVCDEPFRQSNSLHVICSPRCAIRLPVFNRKEEKAKARADRASDKKRREALKTRSEWMQEAQTVVNRYVRTLALSRGEGCYTCGARPAQKFGGTYDAGHFRSVGSAPHLRFWIPQIRLQCVSCNRHKGGMALAFRAALVRDHGQEWVEQLEAMQHVAKFDIAYLARLKAVIGKRLRRLEKKCSAM